MDPVTSGALGGPGGAASNTVFTAAVSMTVGGTETTSTAASWASSATSTTGQLEPGSGGASTTATTGQGAAGADAGSGGTGGIAPDDCEVEHTETSDDACQVTVTCPGFVQHTTCMLGPHFRDHWDCESDEHDSSKPESSEGNPFWYNTVTGAFYAAEACDSMVQFNLNLPPTGPNSGTAECSVIGSISSHPDEAYRGRSCGPRYEASSATVWEGRPASALCLASATGDGYSCSCEGLGADDGAYELDSPDIESALNDVWEFCDNASPALPVELGECDSVANGSGGEGSCEFIDYCPLVLTDDSGIELEEIVYREILCEPDSGAGDLACTCRVRADRQFSFRVSARDDPNVTACENLAQICDPQNAVERAEGPAECEKLAEYFGRDNRGQTYTCSVPISMGTMTGRSFEVASLECAEADGGWLSCICHDRLTDEKTTIEPATADLALAWENAVSLCEAHLEAAPADG